MELKSMKRTAKEKKAEKTVLAKPEAEDYPWGLRLTLDKEELDKLDISLAVGDKVNIQSVAKVISVRENTDENGQRRHVELQITDLGMEPEASRSAAERLYGDKG